MSDTAPTRHAPRALWLIAQAFMQALFALFGNPEDIARAPYRQAKAYKQLALWIAGGEALLRRLLMIEAEALPDAPTQKPRTTRRPHTRAKIACMPEHPQAWPISFRAVPARRRTRTRGARAPRRAFTRHIIDSWPLALRYEALLRAYNNPAPYAARLARHLRAEPRRVHSILRHAQAVIATIGRDADDEIVKEAEKSGASFTRRADSS